MFENPTRVPTTPDDAPSGRPEGSGSSPEGSTTLAWPGAGSFHPAPPLGEDCWFLSGPTASGKSALAVRMAHRLDAEIVSVDSMAVYRGLDVGTAKPTLEQRQLVPHHLVDVAAAAAPYNVATWLEEATRVVADCRARGRGILFVGGTPLYLRALRDGLASLPPADPALRSRLVAEADAGGSEPLHRRLAELDPASAARIHPRDAKRVIRALEVAATTGRPLSSALQASPNQPCEGRLLFEQRLLILDLPRATLHERIDRRVERMFAEGLVEETQAALALPGGIGPTARQAAGYSEAIDLIEGRINRGEAVRRTQQRTRQLAKRQLTWLRSFKQATWIAA
ncbi:MAG: tRNA (adenosine(37)-N6)-dimethylallyltransferase MiaA [Planctomycetia bacterium]|nr:tRNA (adenosine(37)-N6)-dimethylallyltransferase MiaA [Planctomycetia bacterium]